MVDVYKRQVYKSTEFYQGRSCDRSSGCITRCFRYVRSIVVPQRNRIVSLYIIDGFPSEDGMSTLDPAEIETIDVLKDASATAIYGCLLYTSCE